MLYSYEQHIHSFTICTFPKCARNFYKVAHRLCFSELDQVFAMTGVIPVTLRKTSVSAALEGRAVELSTQSLSSLSLPPGAAVLPLTKNVSRALIPS